MLKNWAEASAADPAADWIPVADDTYDLGSSTLEWKDLYVDGKAYIDEFGEALLFGDDLGLGFGDSSDAIFLYETADTNALAFVLGLPHVDENANNVAVFVLVDRDAIGTDLGAGGIDLTGITEPTLVVGNEASDAWASLDAGDVNGSSNRGLYFKPAADEDVELINVGVGGSPRIYWDESEEAFHSTAEWFFDDHITMVALRSLAWAEGITTGVQFDAIATTDQFMLSVGAAFGTQFILTDFGNRQAEHGHVAQTNPTFFVHSTTAVTSETDEWISMTHDVTDGVIGTGSGGIKYQLGDVGITDFTIRKVKVTKAFSSDLFDADATTDSANVWLQPANTILLSAFMRLETQFDGPLHSGLDVTVGLGGDTNGLLAPAAMNMTSDAADTEYSGPGAYFGTNQVVTIGTQQWIAYATSVGDNLGDLTAGTMDFYFVYIEL